MLVVVLLVLIVAAFAVIVAASQSGGDIYGSDANADGLQAMLLAETGIERALKRFATGTACNALGPETINDLTTIGLGNGTNRIVIWRRASHRLRRRYAARYPVPRAGNRHRAVAQRGHARCTPSSDRNLLGGITGAVPPAFNPAFNNPLTAGAPSSWTLTQPAWQNGYANNGGPDVIGAACSRSAYVLKNLTNNYEARAQGVANVNFTVTGGTATTVTFHYRINDRGANAGCAGGGADVGPADICAGAGGNEGTACFRTTEAAGANPSTGTFSSNNTVTQAVACPDAGGVSAFAPCQNGYQAGYPTKGSVAFNITGAGTRTITSFIYMIRLQQGGRREMYLDHIEATNTSAIGAAHVRMWRDCSTTLNPGTCT
jgi:hypothetical protein